MSTSPRSWGAWDSLPISEPRPGPKGLLMSFPSSLVSVPFERPFSLADSLKSGQLFHWEPLVIEGIEGVAGCIGNEKAYWIAQPDSETVLTLSGDEAPISRYFGLDQSLGEIHGTFPREDLVLDAAIQYCPGIRVARQPVWECLATFITSSLKQVTHIRSISMALRQKYGEAHRLHGKTFHGYPSPGKLAEVGETELRTCALGYRAKSLALAGEALEKGEIDLEALENAQDLDFSRSELMRLHGVGEKIANCTLLFSCGKWAAFPIDVWIERILREHYRKRVKGAKLQKWAETYFGENAGYAQQYLFHYARKTM